MPSQTFFNLPKEKQKLIYDAAIKEFSRVPYEEASINQIIQTAKISRGSFYMYFTDKEDLYYYLVTAHKKNIDEMFMKIFQEHDGDIIDSYLSLLLRMIKKLKTTHHKRFFQNMVLNANFKTRSFFPEIHAEAEKRKLEKLVSYIHKESLNVKNDEELYDVVELCNMCLIHSLIYIIKKNQDADMVYKKFERQLMILKEGLYKEVNHD